MYLKQIFKIGLRKKTIKKFSHLAGAGKYAASLQRSNPHTHTPKKRVSWI